MLAAPHAINKLGSPASSSFTDLAGGGVRRTSPFLPITIYFVVTKKYPKLGNKAER